MRYKVALVVKNSSANAGNTGDMGLDSWVKKIPPEWNGTSLQYSCLENSVAKESGGLQSTGL